ncbi:SDR family NAD(P)-dependent oxidoreductase [Micromonospora endolithica]
MFVYPGQGTQWTGMATELLATNPLFRKHLEDCADALAPHTTWNLIDTLTGKPGTPPPSRVDVVQPSLFAMMTALTRVWTHHGITPDAVIGHSQGEITAAHIAGALTLDDAATITALRSQALLELAGTGTMAAINQPPQHIQALLDDFPDVHIAATNSPTTTIVAGNQTSITNLVTHYQGRGVNARRIDVDYASHTPHIDRLQTQILEALAGITPRTSHIPFHSTVTGELIDTSTLTNQYWFTNLRRPVQFHQTITELAASGHHQFVEVSPHPVLSHTIAETTEVHTAITTTHHTIRRHNATDHDLSQALAHAHTHGLPTTWRPSTAEIEPLPAYPFHHQPYWLAAPPAAASGAPDTTHPVLTRHAVLPHDAHVLTGQLDGTAHPESALVDLAVFAAQTVGAAEVATLTITAPLPAGPAQLQVWAGAPDGDGTREFTIRSQPDRDAEWTAHAAGRLAAFGTATTADATAARPASAGPVDVSALGDPTIRAAWRHDTDVYGEIVPAGSTGGVLLDPELLDAALRLAALTADPADPADLVPVEWRGVRGRIDAAGVVQVHARAHPAGTVALTLTRAEGDRLTADAVTLRRTPREWRQAAAPVPLFHVAWPEIPAARDATPATARIIGPDPLGLAAALRSAGWADGDAVGFVSAGAGADDDTAVPAAARALTGRVMTAVQGWLAEDRPTGDRLVVVTRGAVRPDRDDTPADVAAAPVWGLIRTAQVEYPDRLVLLDLDENPLSARTVAAALAAGEPQLAVRGGRLLVPRLAPVDRSRLTRPAELGGMLDPDGTVLITGATGGLGRRLAAHLVTEHGARHLRLVSRRGPGTPGATGLAAGLQELGATVTISACDVTNRNAVAAMLAEIPGDHPLTAVFHAAATTDGGLITSLDPQRLDTVLRTKVDAAWHLHELTAPLELRSFVLFSSLSGVLGNPGQANYAAGNAFLDAVALHRHTTGLPATALAWGLWEDEAGLSEQLSQSDRVRMTESGVSPLRSGRALEMLDLTVRQGLPAVAPTELDRRRLQEHAAAGSLPTLLRGLVRAPATRAAAATSWTGRFAELAEADRRTAVFGLVRSHVAAVLGHTSADDVDPERAFKDLGFESVTVVELRNRLSSATGLRLPPTVVFDHPTVEELSDALLTRLAPPPDQPSVLAELERLELALQDAAALNGDRAAVEARLRTLLRRVEGPPAGNGTPADDLATASDELLFEVLDKELDAP